MPHISRKKLQQKQLNTLWREFIAVVTLKNVSRSQAVLEDLLTDTEQIMLAKRTAAILLLAENISIYKIATRLHLSTSTVKRMQEKYLQGEYSFLVKAVYADRQKKEALYLLINKIARAGMPEMGKNRWKEIF